MNSNSPRHEEERPTSPERPANEDPFGIAALGRELDDQHQRSLKSLAKAHEEKKRVLDVAAKAYVAAETAKVEIADLLDVLVEIHVNRPEVQHGADRDLAQRLVARAEEIVDDRDAILKMIRGGDR